MGPHCHLLVTNQNSVDESPAISLQTFKSSLIFGAFCNSPQTEGSTGDYVHTPTVDLNMISSGSLSLTYCTSFSYG